MKLEIIKSKLQTNSYYQYNLFEITELYMLTTYILLPTYNQEIRELTTNLKYLKNSEVVEIISKYVNDYLHIDIKRLLDLLIEKSIADDVYSPKKWLIVNLLELLKNKRDEITKYDKVNAIPLYNRFRELEFIGEDNDKYLIEEIENCMLGFVNVDDIAELNDQILTYMISKNERTYKEFKDYLLKSKLVKTKCQIDIETLTKKVRRELTEMEETINGINY